MTSNDDINRSMSLRTVNNVPTGRSSISAPETLAQKMAQRRAPPWYRAYPKRIVESKYFTGLTMLLTLYALTGDDIRLLSTNQPADIYFNCLTLICLVVFSVEIILCILGKSDYFLSFFFNLDVISTVSLVLDLTWVNDMVAGDEDDVNNLRGSRTAKIGARATRIVRVIRLVRVVKLYKALMEAEQARKKNKRKDPGDEDDWDDINVNLSTDNRRESRVGKKLSDLATRRVIMLVLLMMIAHRVLRIDPSEQFPTSATYGADVVHEAFTDMVEDPHDSYLRTAYENLILRYIYYHNWFTGKLDKCPSSASACSRNYASQLFWIGIVSSDYDILESKTRLAKVNSSMVQQFEENIQRVEGSPSTTWNYVFGSMPGPVQTILGLRWDARCNTKRFEALGVSLLQQELSDWGVSYPVTCPDDLRKAERRIYSPRLNVKKAEWERWHFAFYFDIRPFVQDEAVYSLLITLFVCIALLMSAILFSSSANRLVLHPVENMIAKVETIRDNPLMAMKVADEEFKVEEMNRAKARKEEKKSRLEHLKDLVMCTYSRKGVAPTEIMETVILEKTIIKLGSLLALGFGEAGANIIEHNMHSGDTAAINAMVEGRCVECIIGVARIRDFSTATEVLQTKVMKFVNQIAEIVHGVVDEFGGYASKNNSDSFLLIWRVTDLLPEKVSKLADMSMLTFVRILGAVHRSPVLAAYRGHPGLQQRMGKNCRVNISTGLHYGWAIEGAVGSEFKIDASYLSPNVSIAESIERATKIYGVSILVAESVVRVCTQAMANKCRLIDRVVISGSVNPMELYVIDLDYSSLSVEPPPIQVNWTSRQRFRVRQALEAERLQKWRDDVQMATLFSESPDIAAMQFRFTQEFIHVFNMGYQNYSQGEWGVAQRLLSRTRKMLGVDDGPSVALLRYMEAHKFRAPELWAGVRSMDTNLLH